MKLTSAALLTTPAASTDDSTHPLSIHTPCPEKSLILTPNMDVPLPPLNLPADLDHSQSTQLSSL